MSCTYRTVEQWGNFELNSSSTTNTDPLIRVHVNVATGGGSTVKDTPPFNKH